MHPRDLRAAGESEQRVATVAAWRDAPQVTEAEKAALALTEAVTRLDDQAGPVPDDVWPRLRAISGRRSWAISSWRSPW
jgi:alkylhydroperoxidase family enzyme